MSDSKNRKGFWFLLVVNISLGFFGNQVSFWLSVLLIGLNYRYTLNRTKMLLLDIILLVSVQTGMWLRYFEALSSAENIDIGMSLLQLFNMLALWADIVLIFAVFTWSFIMARKRKAAWITGSLVCVNILIFCILYRIATQ